MSFKRIHIGLGEVQRIIMRFLEKDSSSAYTIEALAQEVYGYDEDEVVPESLINTVRRSVRSLEQRGLVATGWCHENFDLKLVGAISGQEAGS